MLKMRDECLYTSFKMHKMGHEKWIQLQELLDIKMSKLTNPINYQYSSREVSLLGDTQKGRRFIGANLD